MYRTVSYLFIRLLIYLIKWTFKKWIFIWN